VVRRGKAVRVRRHRPPPCRRLLAHYVEVKEPDPQDAGHGTIMDSLRGQLLISNGHLFDPNFRHTVVLVGEHNADGALGVVLNRELDITVAEAAPPLGSLVPPEDRLFEGGPVQEGSAVLLAELSHPELADMLVFGNIGFLVGEIPADVQPGILRARVFAGYSGWAPGQLEAEMEQDSWILEPAIEEDVFTDSPDLLWSRVLERKGPEYRALSKMPFDPTMN
jgi:putative transcriptional regulator